MECQGGRCGEERREEEEEEEAFFEVDSLDRHWEGCVISKLIVSYISWDLITPVIRLITFRADNISARALGNLPVWEGGGGQRHGPFCIEGGARGAVPLVMARVFPKPSNLNLTLYTLYPKP